MNRQSNGSTGRTALKVLAAGVIALLAIVFGAMGACGLFTAGSSIVSSIGKQGFQNNGLGILLGVLFAFFGLMIARGLVKTVVSMLKKDLDE